tara:strand:- start:642 stop:2291 length:1650 start_codon:yes stop_codon:yes gene_type:complete
MIPFTPASLRGARPAFLLDVTFAGHRWCIGTAAVSLDSDDGPVQYSPGLDLRGIDESFDRLELDPAAQSATLAAVLPDGASVLDLIARGHRLDRCLATVAMIYVDANGQPIAMANGSAQTWENRAILIAGRIQQPQYGAIDKPNGWFGCTVRDSLWEDTGSIIPTTSRVNTTTWPNSRAADAGKVYPLVFGAPGQDGNGVDGYKGSPAYVVVSTAGNADLLLIAGHPVAATTVTLIDTSTTVEGFTVTHQADGMGNICAVVDVTGASGAFDRTGTEYWVCWSSTAAATGGMALAESANGTAVAGVGSLMVYMLNRSTIPADHGRCAAARRQLDRVDVGGYINDADASPWGFISDELLKLVPCSVRRGPKGVYPLPRFEIPRSSAIPALAEGPDFRRLAVQVEETKPAASVEVLYLTAATLTSPSVTWIRAMPAAPTDTTASRSLLLRPEGQAVRVDSPLLWTREAADAVAVGVLIGRPVEAVTVTYSAAAEYAWVSPGDWVAVTDDDTDRGLYWTSRVGQVTGRSWDGTGWEFSIFFETRAPFPARRYG